MEPTAASRSSASPSRGGNSTGDRTSDVAQLASVATSLTELTERIVGIAEHHRNDASNTITPELDEIERALRSARRKLDRLLRRLR